MNYFANAGTFRERREKLLFLHRYRFITLGRFTIAQADELHLFNWTSCSLISSKDEGESEIHDPFL